MGNSNFKPKRGRPTLEQVAAIESSILEAAKNIFLTAGYDAASMEAVASKACVSKCTLYAKYANKETLFESVIRNCIDDWSVPVEEIELSKTNSYIEILKYQLRALARAQLNPEIRAFQNLILQNSDKFPELGMFMHKFGFMKFVEQIEKIIESENVNTVKAPKRIAECMISSVIGWGLSQLCFRNVQMFELEKYAEDVVDLMFTTETR